MILAIASYFYMTNPIYISKLLNGMDLAALRPDVDPEVFQSPVFHEFVITVVPYVAFVVIGFVALIHTIAFYRCYLRKPAAIAYVKVYSFLAVVSLVMWFFYNVSAKNILILIPAAIYGFVFAAERQPSTPAPALDNVLKNDQNY